MATWEDGPEYAPVERPTEYAVPAAPVIEVVAPATPPAAAPVQRPLFDRPAGPVAELARLVPAEPDGRDPAAPFDVAAGALTSMNSTPSTSSAWGAAHWSHPGDAAPQGSWPPPAPTGSQAPWPAPIPAPTPDPTGFPPPGTPQWFGPGPAPLASPPAPVRTDFWGVLAAATPGLYLALGIGGLLHLLAPVMLALAFVASSRVTLARPQIRRAFVVASAVLAALAVVGLLLPSTYTVGDWWSFLAGWCQLACWVLLVTVLVLLRRELLRLASGLGAPQSPSPWR